MADQSWRQQPLKMSDEIIEYTSLRIHEHARQHNLAHVRIILHGGEPLLVGRATLTQIVTRLRAAMPRTAVCSISLQTNGVLLAKSLPLLNELNVQVGVSLDGAAADHNRHRKYRNGNGSHFAVASSLSALSSQTYNHLFRGLLCVIDINSDPLSTYSYLAHFDAPAMDFLLPHRSWADPPHGSGANNETPYADWLIPIFDLWYSQEPQQTRIRIFEAIMDLLLGGQPQVEGLGLGPLRTLVIETDGRIEQSDFLKSAYKGAGFTGLRIQDGALDAALYSPSIAQHQVGTLALSSTCRLCPLHQVCGGGQFAHRYRPGLGFSNPSVYCADLSRLIRYISARIGTDIAKLRRGH